MQLIYPSMLSSHHCLQSLLHAKYTHHLQRPLKILSKHGIGLKAHDVVICLTLDVDLLYLDTYEQLDC